MISSAEEPGFHATLGTIRSRSSGLDHGFEVHRIKMPPLPLGSVLLDLAALGAFNAWFLSAIVLHLNHDSGGFDLQVHVGDLPRRLRAQKQTVVKMKFLESFKSRSDRISPAISPRAPRNFLAPSFRFGPKRSQSA